MRRPACIVLAALLLAAACGAGCATRGQAPWGAAEYRTPRIWPVNCPEAQVTSSFGAGRGAGRNARSHAGIDIAAPKGTPVVATADGVVTFSGRDNAYGRIVRLAHGGGLETWYAHLRSRAVKRGREVYLGERIGKVGKSGRATGCHLHYEVRRNGVPVDPKGYLPVPPP